MLEFIYNQLLFYIALFLVLFLPGYFLLLAIFGKSGKFSSLEKFVLSFGLSIISVDFLMLFMSRVKILLTRFSILAGIFLFVLICYGIYKISRKNNDSENKIESKSYNFSKQRTALIILLLFLTVFIKTAYLKNNVLPSTTDLGHHMYWAKTITQTGTIPDYAMRDITSAGGNYAIGQPQPISDFIIGEHLIFSAINLISGLDFISYFPVVTLYLVNLMGILALFILALRFFEDYAQGENIAILTLFFIGPLFAVAPPQVKYAGGGVIGNIIGNLLLPLTFYFFYRAFKEKNNLMLLLALIFAMGLFYTHHLTGLLLLLIFVVIIFLVLAVNFGEIFSFFRSWLKIIFSARVISFFIFAAVFIFAVYTPAYLTNKAVETVTGGPKKIEHQGLAISEFKFTAGEPRAALGISGVILFLLLASRVYKRKNYREIFLFSWIFIIALITLKPGWLGLSIPSGRVANYAVYPLSIISAFALERIIAYSRKNKNLYFIDKKLFVSAGILLLVFTATSGFYDNMPYFARSADAQKTVQTFAAAEYLAQKTGADDQIVTDHVNVASDSWIKLFFMRDYNFPFYRANLDRYANNVDKQEFCTLWMISTPVSADSRKCFQDLGMDFVMIDKTDVPQFIKDSSFWQVYNNGEINTFYRP